MPGTVGCSSSLVGCCGRQIWCRLELAVGVCRIGTTVLGTPLYRRMAVMVSLSTGIGASMNGLAAMKYLFGGWSALTRTFVVCPGAIGMACVVKALV